MQILSGYRPGAIGRITELHACYYHQRWGFDVNFEAEVARELSEFLRRFDGAADGLWLATLNGTTVGSIAIDGRDRPSAGARLRWFILDPKCQGRGTGKTLMHHAIGFCRRINVRRVYLWTFAGLDAARGIYEAFGFTLREERDDRDWGVRVTHQMFELNL